MNSLYYEFNSSVNLNCFKIDAYWVVFFFKFKKEWGGRQTFSKVMDFLEGSGLFQSLEWTFLLILFSPQVTSDFGTTNFPQPGTALMLDCKEKSSSFSLSPQRCSELRLGFGHLYLPKEIPMVIFLGLSQT